MTLPVTAADKRAIIREYFDRYQPAFCVETGIYDGHGSCFQFAAEVPVYAIDVQPGNCRRAKFNYPHVRVIEGDTTEKLPELLSSLAGRGFFWLDAHWVGSIDGEEFANMNRCPLLPELEAVIRWGTWAPESVVLIDDLRLLGSVGWPTREDLQALNLGEIWDVAEADDILRCTPRSW